MGSTTTDKLRSVTEWEQAVKYNPLNIDLRKCFLKNGMVECFIGTVIADGRSYQLTWDGQGRCMYAGEHLSKFDIHFDSIEK